MISPPHSSERFPPWGILVERHANAVKNPEIPVHWRPTVVDPGARRTQWDAWCEGIVTDLSHKLWPRRQSGAWVGTARDWVDELTRDDLGLLTSSLLDMLDRVVDSPAGDADPGPTHRVLFRSEDTLGFGEFFPVYGRALALEVEKVATGAVGDWADDCINTTSGDLDLVLKDSLQRPRAYQMAHVLGISGFRHQVAKSANTPSMISGHSFHGLCGGIAVEELLRHANATTAYGPALEQYAADVGDRRVFAGVHYPSDNIGSWVTALRVAKECCTEPGLSRQFVLNAIGRSHVAKAIANYASAHPARALASAWKMLQEEMS